MFTRIQWRIAAAYVVLIVVAMGALGIYLVETLREQQLRALEDQLAKQASLVADDTVYRMHQGATPAQLDALAKSLSQEIGARVTIIGREGTVLGESDHDPLTMENHATRPEVVQALRLGRGQSERHSATLDRDLLYVAVPMREGDTVVGVARVALPIQTVNALLNRVALIVAVATAATGLLAIALSVAIARATTRPVEQLTRLARRVAAGHLDERIAGSSRDEVGQLAAAFNQMAGELRATIGEIDAQRAELTAVLAGMADGVMIADGQRRVVALNRAAERLLEIGDAAARGRSVAEVVRQHDLVARLATDRSDGAPLLIEVGRDRRQVQVVVTPLHRDGETRHVILFQDVTELRRAEAIRRDFVANVSHELRTPLASLRALVETLEDGALDDPPAAREFLGRMHVEVDGLTQMVGELLELARIESGRVQLRFARGDVREIVQTVVGRLRPQAERQGVALSVEIPDGPAEAVVDASRIEAVVVNLVHNAIKFTPPGGAVRVTVEPRDGEIALVVADTGIGVDPRDLPRLFERFYKTDRSRATSGTGLGLAIVKHLVQAHGGTVWAESPGPGQGATFGVLLPVAGPVGDPANGHVRSAAGL